LLSNSERKFKDEEDRETETMTMKGRRGTYTTIARQMELSMSEMKM